MSALPVVVLGAGITGLTVARGLERAGRSVRIFEASERTGGNIRTERHDGFLYDVGPDSFLKTRPEGARLATELGLEGEFITPRAEGRDVWVAREGRLFPMPDGLSLGVPTKPSALLESDLLSDLGKARAFLEPFIPRRRARGEETLREFFTRRLGSEMADRIAAPLLAGVSAGSAERLSIDAAFPRLVELERRHGSLLSGLLGGRPPWEILWDPPPPRGSPFLSFRSGLSRLIEALVAELSPGVLQLGTRIERVRPTATGVEVVVAGESVEASHLVLTGGPWHAAELLADVHPELAQVLASIRSAPTATVFFAFDERVVERPFEGSGFIVPEGEGDILAATFVSSKWDERAPRGRALVRVFLGGARTHGALGSDDECISLARRELERLWGASGAPSWARVFRYEHGTPQLELGHGHKLERIAQLAAELPWLSLAGPGYAGIGIPECIRSAESTCARLVEPT